VATTGARVGERLRAVAREAAAQARRARLPEIDPVSALGDLAGRRDVVIADRDGGPVGDLPEPSGGSWTVVVGPEGGLESGELQSLGNASRLSLGPHILRAETAPIAAVSVMVGRSHEMFREW
jgi:16S rRNA (uracil1498-N3)-methyltransferase